MARPVRYIICPDCGGKKKHHARGLCKECYKTRWYLKHREERLAASVQWARDNLEKVRTANARHYLKNREKKLAKSQQRYRENPEKHKAIQARYDKNHPEVRRGIEARRTAREKTVPDTLTSDQAKRLLAIGQAIYPGEELHLDHIVPLYHGGGTTGANMHAIPATLNLMKHNKLPEEVYRQLCLI